LKINTVNGPIDSATLGRTLMHEHLVVGLPGWESDTATPAPEYRNLVATCVDRVQELKDAAFSSMLDPCPNDLGRDVNLMADVSARTGLNIIFATGLYNGFVKCSSEKSKTAWAVQEYDPASSR